MKKFVNMYFTCNNCNTKNELDVIAYDKSRRYNHECKCGAKYFANRLKNRVRRIGALNNNSI